MNNLGFFYDQQSEISKAIKAYNKGLKIFEEIENQEGAAFSFAGLGGIYDSQGDISKAIEYYHKSLNIFEKTGKKYGIGVMLNNIG